MKFLKAKAIEYKPFMQWNGWAKSVEELAEMGEFENPLIVGEDYIPENINGVCPLKIENGALVERTEEEIAILVQQISESEKNNEVAYLRKYLRELFFEIQFCNSINEATTALQTIYNQKLTEYNNLKE